MQTYAFCLSKALGLNPNLTFKSILKFARINQDLAQIRRQPWQPQKRGAYKNSSPMHYRSLYYQIRVQNHSDSKLQA
eukprot:1139613-Pelagomonas_calceolata.AAC.5